jgi:hypothetical protein
MANEMRAVTLKGVTNADATQDGTHVLFQLETESGQRQTLACSADALAHMVAVLSAAGQRAAKIRGEGGELSPGLFQLVRGLLDPKTTVGFEYGSVTLSLYPLAQLPLHIGLSPDRARKLSADLADASAKAERKPSP